MSIYWITHILVFVFGAWAGVRYCRHILTKYENTELREWKD